MYPPSPPTSARSDPSSLQTDDASPGPSNWSNAPSPTESESEANFLDEYEEAEARRLDEADSDIHTPPMTPSSTFSSSPASLSSQSHGHTTATTATSPKSLSHPYPRPLAPSSSNLGGTSRPRIRGLAPLTSVPSSLSGNGNGNGAVHMPKSQPLSRALFQRMASDTPHAGMKTGSKPKASTKLIVPTKAFRTTFELGLSASELARR